MIVLGVVAGSILFLYVYTLCKIRTAKDEDSDHDSGIDSDADTIIGTDDELTSERELDITDADTDDLVSDTDDLISDNKQILNQIDVPHKEKIE